MSVKDWEPVIGLEIHVQLKTRTKMFCGCELSFGEEPNTRTCPVCLGLPGSLPVVNARAIHYGLLMGEAFGCEIAPRSIFARKNYFYPDQAKNYQISQYDTPALQRRPPGRRAAATGSTSRRTPRSSSTSASRAASTAREASIVDYNRGGTPLAEIVTEPDIHSAEEARDWLNLLRVTLRQLGVSDVNMEEGSLRADANVSVRRKGETKLGTKTELKNMNSFRFLMQGINAEVKRQVALLEGGGRVQQETLHFDPGTGRLNTLRSKEEAHDYRYFPEPDLVPVVPTERDAPRGAGRAAGAAGRARRALRDGLGDPGGHGAAVRVRARLGRLLRGGRDGRRAARGAPGRQPRDGAAHRASTAPSRPPRRPPRRRSPGWRGSSRSARRRRATPARCSRSSPARAATRRRSSSARASARWPTTASWRASSPR